MNQGNAAKQSTGVSGFSAENGQKGGESERSLSATGDALSGVGKVKEPEEGDSTLAVFPGKSPAGHGCVEEMSGLTGAFVFTELMLQRLWLRGRFMSGGAVTQDGRAVVVRHPGRWNRQGGPDFLGAKLRIGASEITGDVELHLRESDWAQHGHSADPAYAGVVLHVVLFPPREAQWTGGVGGKAMPILALLPLLPYDLEEHAIDDAAEELAGGGAAEDAAALLELSPLDCMDLLHKQACRRWATKTACANELIERYGWQEACHRAALDCLGFRDNRLAMAELAARHPLAEWAAGRVRAEDAFAEVSTLWGRAPGRPANHPLTRLRQYERWVDGCPDWPTRLHMLMPFHVRELALTCAKRRVYSLDPGFEGLRELRSVLSEWVCDGKVPGSRFESFVGDVIFPFLTVAGLVEPALVHELWLRWYPGDLALNGGASLKRLFAGLTYVHVNCNGMHQGFKGWRLARAAEQGAGKSSPAYDS